MIRKLKGGNFDLDLCSANDISWPQDPCPWNEEENSREHLCAVRFSDIGE